RRRQGRRRGPRPALLRTANLSLAAAGHRRRAGAGKRRSAARVLPGATKDGGEDMRIIIAALTMAMVTTAGAQEPATPAPIDDLAWMAGAWTQTDDRGVTTRETWLEPLGGAMSGVGQTTRPGGRTSFEF